MTRQAWWAYCSTFQPCRYCPNGSDHYKQEVQKDYIGMFDEEDVDVTLCDNISLFKKYLNII